MRILFQGDSITDADRDRDSQGAHRLGHGYASLVAAKLSQHESLNRGISGNTILDLQRRWTQDTLDLQPDLLSLLIGVNDEARGVPIELFEQSYEHLLTQARQANSELRLVLCEPFILPVGGIAYEWDRWHGGLRERRKAVARLAAKHGAVLVHFQQILDGACHRSPPHHWLWDGVHPTEAGHQLMADEWERVVRAKWSLD